jgi:hypothetical protein
MPRVGFEPTIPVFERAKTVHDLDRAADHCDMTVWGGGWHCVRENCNSGLGLKHQSNAMGALCNKPEGSGFDSLLGHWIFHLT